MSKVPSSIDVPTASYEAYIDEKWKTLAIGGVITIESVAPDGTGDVEGGIELETLGPHRPTGFKVWHPYLPTNNKWFLIVFAILVGLFLFSLDNTIVANIQPTIVEQFQSVEKIAWVGTGFFLSSAALTLPSGQIYQIFNAKWLYVFSVFIFEIGSALCGAAPNMNALIVGRVIAGIGSTGIYTGSLFLLSVNTSEQERYCVSEPVSHDLDPPISG